MRPTTIYQITDDNSSYETGKNKHDNDNDDSKCKLQQNEMSSTKQTSQSTAKSALQSSNCSRNVTTSGDEFKYERIRKIGIGSYVSDHLDSFVSHLNK